MFLSESKEKNNLAILECWSILKEKIQDCLKVFYGYHENKLFGVY
jgi:hypothetical protein